MKLCPDAFRLMKSWHQFKTSTGMLPNSETNPLVSQIYTKKNRVSASLVFILFDIFELLFAFEGSVRFKLVPERLMVTNLFKQTLTVARVDNSWSLKVWNYRPETQEKLWHIKSNVFAFPSLLLLTAPTEFLKEGRHFCFQAVVMLRLGPNIEARPSSNSGRCERSLNLKKKYKGTKYICL